MHHDRVSSNFSGVEVLGSKTTTVGMKLAESSFPGTPSYLAYSADGTVRVHRIALDGADSAMSWKVTALASATGLVSYEEGGSTWTLLYNKSTGAMRTYELTAF
jgi:hypothetical protein